MELEPHLQKKDMVACVDKIQEFWGNQLPPTGNRGSFWRDLVKAAHMKPGEEYDPTDYSTVTDSILLQISTIFPGQH